VSNLSERRTKQGVPELAPEVTSVIYVGKFAGKGRPLAPGAEKASRNIPSHAPRSHFASAIVFMVGALGAFAAVVFVWAGITFDGLKSNPARIPKHQPIGPQPDVSLGLSVDATIVVQAPAHVALRIGLRGGREAPPKSFLHLSGLPPVVGLTAGRVIGPGEWVVPTSALQNLAMNVPANVSGSFQIVITLLVGGERTQVLTAHARTTLVVASATPIESLPGQASATLRQEDRAGTAQAKGEAEGPVAGGRDRDAHEERGEARRSDSERAAVTRSDEPVTTGPEETGPTEAASLPASAANSVRPRAEVTPPQVPTVTPEDRLRAEQSLARGQRDLQDGNIAQARLWFHRAAEAGIARGALLLAATYDPRELGRLGVLGVRPNVALARNWYERAQQLGEPEAKERLARLVDN
jgi:hypothetical protein